MKPSKTIWPIYVHDENQICDTCKGNGYVPNPRRELAQFHPHSTCGDCCGSGNITQIDVRKAA